MCCGSRLEFTLLQSRVAVPCVVSRRFPFVPQPDAVIKYVFLVEYALNEGVLSHLCDVDFLVGGNIWLGWALINGPPTPSRGARRNR